MSPTWDDVENELAGRLPGLRDGDAILLSVGAGLFIQFVNFDRTFDVLTSGCGTDFREDVRLTDAQGEQMLALGWQPPRDEPNFVLDSVRYPLEAGFARRTAALMVTTLREVYGARSPAEVTFTSFSNRGMRAPTLTTVAMDSTQKPEIPLDTAALLPDPDPTWRRRLETILAGVGEWSQAEIGSVFTACGFAGPVADRYRLTAVDGAVKMSARNAAWPPADFHDVTVRESVPLEEGPARFRAALAAAVAVLGDPPLVGGPGAFARWRKQPSTVIVSHERYRTKAGVTLTVTPTDVIEGDEYRSHQYQPGWVPDHLWLTEPDTDRPENRTLSGAMVYDHPPSENVAELRGHLRTLFESFAMDLPLLYPLASNARFRVHNRQGSWLLDGEFTHEHAWIDAPNSGLATLRFTYDGSNADRANAHAMADRFIEALSAAGVTDLRGASGMVWSATPAERLDASALTLPYHR